MKRADMIIAETIGWDITELRPYRYQRYTHPTVYAIGDQYLAAHPTAPKHDVGGPWRANRDQFGARGTKSTVWVCDAISEK